jgi:hypothetical protein
MTYSRVTDADRKYLKDQRHHCMLSDSVRFAVFLMACGIACLFIQLTS